MTIPFTKKTALNIIAFLLFTCSTVFVSAQGDTTVHKPVVDTSGAKKLASKPKEIVKLEDLNLPEELYYRIKTMKPNQLLNFREDFSYNLKADDGIEYTITIRLGFSEDMITGIVKWAPLYNNNETPTEITKIKVKVQFCCTTPIDTLHKKQHCGKMSELNDFEDNEHCKDWEQKDDGKREAENVDAFGKPGAGGKKGKGGVSGRTSATDDGFGKPEPKGKKGKGKNIQEPTDSTNYRPEPDSTKENSKGKDSKKKGSKEETKKTTSNEKEESGGTYGKPEEPVKDKKKKDKKKKGKEKEKQAPPTDSTNYRPEPVAPPAKDEDKKETAKTDSTDSGGFGKPVKEKKKKKG
jgi:hypothetical protein